MCMPGTTPADPRGTATFAIQVDRDARTSDFQISDSCATSYAHPPLSVGPYSDDSQHTLSVNNYSWPVGMHLPPMAIVPGLSTTGSGISPHMGKLYEDRHTTSISNQSELCTLLYLSSHFPPHPLYCSPVAFFDHILPYHQNIATEPGIQFYGIGLALGGALYIFSLLLMALLGAKLCKQPSSCAGYGNVPVITVTPPLDEPALQEVTVPGKDMICIDEMYKVSAVKYCISLLPD
ncbi:hypothetical protein K474DRAFT_1656303 [Panus rudis PR-1116 ss-1]|nr:hypothetical protein K474DRAFT_1656303 [Panus rudis PR-1116 ss-1]